jgi:hypothetical protein
VTAGVVIPAASTASCRPVLDADGHPVGAICHYPALNRGRGGWTVTVYRRVFTVDTLAEADRVALVLLDHRAAGCWMGLQPNETCRCDPAVSS